MKKKDRYYVINRAVREWNEYEPFNYNFKVGNINVWMPFFECQDYSSDNFELVEDSYCCYGLWNSCWQEPVFEGNWDMTAADCKERLFIILKECKKYCKKDARFYVSERKDSWDFLIVMRDKWREDFRWSFRREPVNEELGG